MKGLTLGLILFFCNNAFADNINVNKIRTLYQESAKNEKACNELISMLSEFDDKNPLLLGYKASGTMMMAKYASSPFSKLSYFKNGKRMLEQAIKVDVKNVELRFLRFMTQNNVPFFLNYNDNIEDDKKFILNNISYIKDKEAKNFMTIILKQTQYLNSDEKKLLNIKRY